MALFHQIVLVDTQGINPDIYRDRLTPDVPKCFSEVLGDFDLAAVTFDSNGI